MSIIERDFLERPLQILCLNGKSKGLGNKPQNLLLSVSLVREMDSSEMKIVLT